MHIQKRDPQHLKKKYTKGLLQIPELPDDSEEFLAICAGLKKAGFIRPILLNEQDQVIDDHSRSLLRAALRWQMKEVPVQVHDSEEAAMLRLHSLAHVRHLSKAAIAYLAVPDLELAFQLAHKRKLESLRKGQEIPVVHSADDGKSVDELAAELGVGRTTLMEARKVRTAFEDPKKYTFNVVGGKNDGAEVEMTLREWFEPRLLRAFVGGEHEQNRPLGLGGIIAGIKTVKNPNKDTFNPKVNGQLSLFENKVDFVGGWKYWTALPAKEQAQHFQNVTDRLELIPDEQRDQLADYLEKLAKNIRKTIKEGK